MTAERLELELRREKLIKKSARLGDVVDACRVAAAAAKKHKRLAELECNGRPTWNQALQIIEHKLTDAQAAKIDKDMTSAREAAYKALKSILVPGLEYDFRNDAVYCMLRVRDKDNRRAFSL